MRMSYSPMAALTAAPARPAPDPYAARYVVQGFNMKRRYWDHVSGHDDKTRALLQALQMARVGKVAFRVWDRRKGKEVWRGYGAGAAVEAWKAAPPKGLVGVNARRALLRALRRNDWGLPRGVREIRRIGTDPFGMGMAYIEASDGNVWCIGSRLGPSNKGPMERFVQRVKKGDLRVKLEPGVNAPRRFRYNLDKPTERQRLEGDILAQKGLFKGALAADRIDEAHRILGWFQGVVSAAVASGAPRFWIGRLRVAERRLYNMLPEHPRRPMPPPEQWETNPARGVRWVVLGGPGGYLAALPADRWKKEQATPASRYRGYKALITFRLAPGDTPADKSRKVRAAYDWVLRTHELAPNPRKAGANQSRPLCNPRACRNPRHRHAARPNSGGRYAIYDFTKGRVIDARPYGPGEGTRTVKRLNLRARPAPDGGGRYGLIKWSARFAGNPLTRRKAAWHLKRARMAEKDARAALGEMPPKYSEAAWQAGKAFGQAGVVARSGPGAAEWAAVHIRGKALRSKREALVPGSNPHAGLRGVMDRREARRTMNFA